MLKALFHYFLILKSGLFDRGYYLLTNPDVRKADVDALWHFVRLGWKEGRNPSHFFDISFYLDNNPDVRQIDINPLIHYIRHGKNEGRYPNPVRKLGKGYFDFELIQQEREPNMPVYTDAYLQTFPINQDDDTVMEDFRLSIPEMDEGEISKIISDDVPQYDEKVSIIIPTKNAGKEFNFLLKMLTNQKGFKEIEIVIVDSGSTDNTLEIAKSYNAKIVEILPEEFSHSFARNLGAKNATGDYFLFTVQDALPPTKTWLNKLMTTIKTEDVIVASCAELPREDADLFYRVKSWNHYKFLEVNQKDRILSMPADPNHINLRKNGQISDLACLISAKLFLKYKYRLSYAEDLDLGIRLIKDGKRIAFLGTMRIIHSHNRPAFYLIKRGYVDNLFLSDIFSDFVIPEVYFQNVAQDIAFTYNFFNTQICEEITQLDYPVNILTLESTIKQQLHSADTFAYPKKEDIKANHYINGEILAFIDSLLDISGYAKVGNNYDGTLIKGLLGFINMTFEYLKGSHDLVDKHLAEEIKYCIFKEISILSGGNLAYSYINGLEKEKDTMHPIHSYLRESV